MFGLTTATFACLMGQPRIFYSMAVDGLLFKVYAKISPRTGVPTIGTVSAACAVYFVHTIFSVTASHLLSSFEPGSDRNRYGISGMFYRSRISSKCHQSRDSYGIHLCERWSYHSAHDTSSDEQGR